MRVTTLLAVIAIALTIAYLIWQLVNSKLAGHARRNNQKRTSDKVKLKGADKAAYRQAQKLYQEGNFRGSSKILESMGLVREAITILEKSGFIREAADTLIRIQRPNRAGSLLARNGMWKEAMECFKKANLSLEVGRCARELGDLPTAIPYFLEAKANSEAAECYLELGKHHEAAKIFFRIKEFDRAIEQYVNFVDNYQDIEKVSFTDQELDFILKKLVEDRVDTRLADILIAKKRLPQLIVELLRSNNLRSATAAFMRNTIDIGPELIAFNDFKREENMLLAALFSNVGAYEYSGMVYERMEEFDKAGESFEKGELYERAIYCFERIQNKAKATEMRILVATHGTSPSKSSRPPAANDKPTAHIPDQTSPIPQPQRPSNPFSIQDTSTDAMKEPQLAEGKAIAAKAKKDSVPPPSAAYLGGISLPTKHDEPMPDPKVDWDPFFRAEFLVDLSSAEQKLLQNICVVRDFPKSSVILDYNQAPAGIYFILGGRVTVFKIDKEGDEIPADELQASDTFGELWLLKDQPTKVKFTATSPATLGCIKRAEFEQLMDQNGAIARKLYRRYAHKLLSKLLNEQHRLKKKVAS
ncbi:MAG: cyclic nucleotide-binding domain-containing protein [Oligoflexus sp.]|nr:cyclic nucleotide-binding domain-containing protein [Oligoflexus sp.]